MAEADGGSRRSLLGFFGLETGEKAWDAFLWAAPYLCLLVAGLVGMSFAVQWFFPLPLSLHGAAIVLAALYFFLFLARVRHVADAAEASEGGETDDGSAPSDGP